MAKISLEFTGRVFILVDTETKAVEAINVDNVDRPYNHTPVDYEFVDDGNINGTPNPKDVYAAKEIFINTDPEDLPTVELEW